MKANDYIHCSDLRRLTKAQLESFSNYLKLMGVGRTEDLASVVLHLHDQAVVSFFEYESDGLVLMVRYYMDSTLKSRYSYDEVLRMAELGSLV